MLMLKMMVRRCDEGSSCKKRVLVHDEATVNEGLHMSLSYSSVTCQCLSSTA